MDSRKIIRRPLITEKSASIQTSQNKYAFEVDPNANKIQIKKAIRELFNVTPVKVTTLNFRGKIKQVRRVAGKKADWKKAVVTLKEGEKLDFIEEV
jgi:large subunit ribosomal protein L23